MNRDGRILSAVPYPIKRTSDIPEWRDECAAMLRSWRDEGAATPQWQEGDVPARRFDASDEWDDKWLRPLLIMPPPPGSQSQPAKAKSGPQEFVVEAPTKRADTSAECDAKRRRPESSSVQSSQAQPSEPPKIGNVGELMEAEAMPLKLRFLRWLFRLQCQAKRYATPDLVAYYFTGGAPHSFQVGNMSASGLYLLTSERWAPGTLIQMTLQKKDGSSRSPKDSIRVLSELVRFDENGAGFNFILPDYEYLCAYGLRPEEVLDRKSIELFMRKVGVRAR